MTRCDDLAKIINGSFDLPAGALDNAAGGLTNFSETAAGHLLPNSSSKGIFLGTSSVATEHLLDNYKEGDWTPAYSATSLVVSSYSLQVGRFIRIGHCVWIYGEIATGGITTQGASTSLKISGLPFFVKNESFTRSAIQISTCSSFGADNFPKFGTFEKNTTTITLHNFASSDPRDGVVLGVLANNMATTSSDNRLEFSGHYRVS